MVNVKVKKEDSRYYSNAGLRVDPLGSKPAQKERRESGRSMVEMLGTLAIMVVLSGPAWAADCTGPKGGAGIDIVGVDGHHYCRSKIGMNWWSAFAWCEGMDRTLISLEDCNGIDGSLPPTSVACPNFDEKNTGNCWTSSVVSGSQAYFISSGSVSPGGTLGRNDTRSYALCK